MDRLNSLNLLYVEDDTMVMKSSLFLFKKLFHRVCTAANGKEALALFQENPIHLIITDVKMPLMDGIELIEKIRSIDKDIPIIFTSSFTEKEYLLNAIHLDTVDYLVKPFTYQDLEKSLKKVLNILEKQNKLLTPLADGVMYHPQSKTLYANDEQIILPYKESLLLELLLANKGRLVTKSDIEHTVYQFEGMSEDGLRNLLKKLRAKIGKDLIMTIKNSGYILK
jgi:DNA-binding response OmpR family regulator